MIHGGAKGADALGARWAAENSVETVVVPADWETHGKAAGPIRNAKMLRLYYTYMVVAFPGGSGTRDMIAKARAASVIVREIS